MGTSSPSPVIDTPSSGLFIYDEEKEKSFLNSVGKIDLKELFMESLSPEFLKLFKKNINLFYSQPFYEGISYEYGLFDKSKNLNKAFKIYKDAADFKYDYLCMYRMHRIFLIDYKEFGVKKNEDLHILYLYKCFAYSPYIILDHIYYILNKIDMPYEIALILDNYDNEELEILDKFMDFLELNKNKFNITSEDISLMKFVLKGFFKSNLIKQDIGILDKLLKFKKVGNAYYEAQLKYCNFYLDFSGEKCDKEKIRNIFNNLIKAKYYKACFDYGNFLIKEKKYDEAKTILKKGFENGQQFCFGGYSFLLIKESNIKQILTDYKLASQLLKNNCLIICLEKLNISSFYYMINYLIKHSSFKQKVLNDYSKYALEIYAIYENYNENGNEQYIENIFTEKIIIEHFCLLGRICYYGIQDIKRSDKENAIIYFTKAYKLAKEKDYDFLKRISYLYIYKCRKYLFKNNKITLRKLNKTKEKLFRFYEECDIDNFNKMELYNYYKLYKIGVYGSTQNKLIQLLEKDIKCLNFDNLVYIEKCRLALEKENSSNSSFNQNNLFFKNEDFNKDDINLYFKTLKNQQYTLRVAKNIQFIIVIHKLYTKYPELDMEKTGIYVSNGNKINIFDTIQDNGLVDGSVIFITKKINYKRN